MLTTLNWMRSYSYRRKMNRHWSISTSRHRSEDDKTICEERTLIDDLLFESQSIIFIRDKIRDHLSRFFLHLTQIFTFISLSSLSRSSRAINQIRDASQSEHFTSHINHWISAMTFNSESLANWSEERRIIITNKKNDNLKKEHLIRKIIIWKRHNLKNFDLWEQFRDEFDD
jgi:hypothetical protein